MKFKFDRLKLSCATALTSVLLLTSGMANAQSAAQKAVDAAKKKIQTTKSEKKGDEGKKKVKYRRPCILLLLQPSENGSRIPTMSSRKRRNPRSPSLRPEAAVRANIWKGQFLVSDSNESARFLFLWLPLLWPFFFFAGRYLSRAQIK